MSKANDTSTPAERAAAYYDVVDHVTHHQLTTHLMLAFLGATLLFGGTYILVIARSQPAAALLLAVILLGFTPALVSGVLSVTAKRRTLHALTQLLGANLPPAEVHRQYVALKAERKAKVAAVKRWVPLGAVVGLLVIFLLTRDSLPAAVAGFVLTSVLVTLWNVAVVRDAGRGTRLSALLAMDTIELDRPNRTP